MAIDTDILKLHPLLEALRPEQLSAVAATARIVELAPEQTLFHMNDPAEHFYWVLEGNIKLFRISPDGQEKVVEIIRPDQSFAEAVMFMPHRRYPVNATAVDAARILALNSDTFLTLLEASPESCLRMLGTLSMRLRFRLNDIEALSLQNAKLRVINFLLQLEPDAEQRIALPAPKRVIAARLSIQPETFSRVLHQLTDAGVIAVDRNSIHLSDPDGLRALAIGD